MQDSRDGRDGTMFIAVLYVNRSGSTLFSRLVSERFPDACVFPELSFPIQLLMARSRGRRLAGSELHAVISADPRYEALGIEEPDLLAICAANSSDDLPALFNSLAASSRRRRPHGAVLFKLETLLDVTAPLLDGFPGVKFIHVVRDPRAVASSMLRTPVPEKPGFNMARGSIVYAARHWRQYIRRVEALARIAPVLTVKYESLGAAFPQVAAELETFLDMNAARTDDMPEAKTYVTAAIDSELHRNIHKPFISDRIDGWSHELSSRDVDVVEAICRDEMAGFGYGPDGSAARKKALTVPLANARHAAAMVRHVTLTLRHYMRRKDGLQALAQRARLAGAKRFSGNDAP